MNDDIDYKGVADYQRGYKAGYMEAMEQVSRIVADLHDDMERLEGVHQKQAD